MCCQCCEKSSAKPAYWDGRSYTNPAWPRLSDKEAKRFLIETAVITLVVFAVVFGGIVLLAHSIAG